MRRCAPLLLLCLLPACGKVRVDKEFCQVKHSVRCRTHSSVEWEQSCEDAAQNRKRVSNTISRPISRDQAVCIALSNNRALQAALEDLGIAKADLVQAGLFTNPQFDWAWRIPTPQDLTFLGVLSDIWQVPLRKRAANQQLIATQLNTTQLVIDTITEARNAYNARVIALDRLQLAEDILEDTIALTERIIYRQSFGFVNDLERYLAEVMLAKQQIAVLSAEKEAKQANVHLRWALGLDESFKDVELTGVLNPPIFEQLCPIDLISKAKQCNLDLQAHRHQICAAQRNLKLQKMRVLRFVSLGVAMEREDVTGWGPAGSIQVPLFDQNQAQIAKAHFLLRQAEKALQAREIEIISQLKMAITRFQIAQQQLAVYGHEIVPLWRHAEGFTCRQEAMKQLNALLAIEAHRSFAEARNMELDLLLTAMTAYNDIERLVGMDISRCR